MPTTTNEWLGLALAAAFLLLLAAVLAALAWRGLRALRSAAREGRVDDADGAWRSASTGSVPERSPAGRHPVLWWVAQAVTLLVVAPVAILFRAVGTTERKGGEEFGVPGSRTLGFGVFNYRKGRCDDGLDPYGIYAEDMDE